MTPSAARLIRLLVLLALVIQPFSATAASPVGQESNPAASVARQPDPAEPGFLFRASVALDDTRSLARLEATGVLVLKSSPDTARPTAVVLADGDQLQELARLGFRPHAADELGALASGQGESRRWLVESLEPLLSKSRALAKSQAHGLVASIAAQTDAAALQDLRAGVAALSPEQIAAVTDSISLDDDADGLTNTEEAWWCTDQGDANTDDDAFNYSDGQEVNALLNFTLPRLTRWNYGPPFGPPAAWPNFNDSDGTHTKICNDGDYDTIPDYAEAYVVGTRIGTGDSENTDGDKYDDGQEFFGITFCLPGQPNCGYGLYPRNQDFNFITNAMPEWIRPPGDNPFVAAYPVIDFLVDPATIAVTAKEIRTVERTITQGEEISTGFAETTGNSTTVGTIDTNEHSTWQENSTTEGGIEPASVAGAPPAESSVFQIPEVKPKVPADASQAQAAPGGPVAMLNASEVLSADRAEVTKQALALATSALPRSEFYAVTGTDHFGEWQFVSVVGLAGTANPKHWDALTDGNWYGVVLIGKGLDGKLVSAAQGTDAFTQLVAQVPDALLAPAAKLALDPMASTSQCSPPFVCSTSYRFPWELNKQWEFGKRSVHKAGYTSFTGTPEWAAVDVGVLGFGAPKPASRTVYAAHESWVGWKCDLDTKSHAYRVGNFIYAHLHPDTQLTTGQSFKTGQPIGNLQIGDFEGSCGTADNYGTTGFHLHWGFPNTGSLQVSGWTLKWDTDLSDTCPLGSCDASATWRREGRAVSSGLPLSAEYFDGSDQIVCAPARLQSSQIPQPAGLNQATKTSSFFERVGQSFRSFLGKLLKGGGATVSSISSSSLAGCASGSCSDQVGSLVSASWNFSDNRTSAQCPSSPGSGPESDGWSGGGGSGAALNNNGDGTFDSLRVWSQTTTNGEGWSTSHSELRSETSYSEITRSETNTLVSSEAWATATTVDPTDAGLLTFNYNLYNTGSDAAVRLTNVRINVLIGDLPAITWSAPDNSDILPGQAKGSFEGGPIKLTLEQLAAIDNGAPIRVVLADYGYDDNLYDANAWGRGILFHVDDGPADGDESIDTYLVTTNLVQGETYQDTLARYFPVKTFEGPTGDERNGTLTSITTPEFAGDGEITGWTEYPVNDHAWWELSISLGGETDGVKHFRDMPARAKTDVYLRYVLDTDSDGFSDRAEIDAASDPNDPDIHPRPLVTVAQHTTVSGSTGSVQVTLQNDGNLDASSVELWAVAPDDSITITDNLIGGGGRVRAGRQVVLGARIGKPDLAAWTTSTAKPYPDGQYEGAAGKSYKFRADASGNVGSGTLPVSWSYDGGATWQPALALGGGYAAWTALPLSDGLTIVFSEGYIAQGETFTFATALPIDTFSYTINRTPHSEPLIVASYNDPQGNHKFVSDVQLVDIQTDLASYLGDMRYGFQLDVMAAAPYSEGSNTAHLVFNNPASETISGANLYVEFAAPDGTVAKEYVLSNQTLLPGPNVVTFDWNTADFNPAYDPTVDYHILVFAADRQGTIFENTVKDLDQVGKDRLPVATLPEGDWNFGEAQQGTLMQRTLAVANTGEHHLLAYVTADTPAIDLSSDGSSTTVVAGDLHPYVVTVNTQHLPVGAFEGHIEVRTSDPLRPARTITVIGSVTPMPMDASSGATVRPLDIPLTVSGNAGDQITYSHDLAPNPSSLHPVRVYSENYARLWGIGKEVLDFSDSSEPLATGDGRDGELKITTNKWDAPIDAPCTGTIGTSTLSASNPMFAPGQLVLIHQTYGTNAGTYLRAKIVDYVSGTVTLDRPLNVSYSTGAQVLVIKQYTNVTVNPGTTWYAKGWNGTTGGILAFAVRGSVVISGTVSANSAGHGGGWEPTNPELSAGQTAYSGGGTSGNQIQTNNTGGTGGGGSNTCNPRDGGDSQYASGAGGGGNGTPGGQGQTKNTTPGTGGLAGGTQSLSKMVLGGGGGAGGYDGNRGVSGGAGGGAVFIAAGSVDLSNGYITAAGQAGAWISGDNNNGLTGGCGGGGAGGSVLIKAGTVKLGTNRINVEGGPGGIKTDGKGGNGGAGGQGRIHVDFCNSMTGSSSPSAFPTQITCHMVKQVEAEPFDQGRLTLPESYATPHPVQVQYGRRYVFTDTLTSKQSMQLPKQLYTAADLDLLVSHTSAASGNLDISLDVGDDGSPDWSYASASATFPISFTITSLTSAFNSYLVGLSTAVWGADTAVPVRVTINRSANVMLTNLVLRQQSSEGGAQSSVSTGEETLHHPLDVPIVITGTHKVGAAYEFNHQLGPEPESIEPCIVFDEGRQVTKGLGRYCSDYTAIDNAAAQMFGSGSLGSRLIASGEVVTFCQDATLPCRPLMATSAEGSQVLAVSSSAGYAVGDMVLALQMQGGVPGQYEYGTVSGVDGNTLLLNQPLAHTYTVGGNAKVQVVRVPQYQTLTLNGGTVTTRAWDGSTGGVVVLKVAEDFILSSGSVDVKGKGFRGGAAPPPAQPGKNKGEGEWGPAVAVNDDRSANGCGGGPGNGLGGGGGGNLAKGENGWNVLGGQTGGEGGYALPGNLVTSVSPGCGGGAGSGIDGGGRPGGSPTNGGAGGNGGGLILLSARNAEIAGSIDADGSKGADAQGSTGFASGGAGGGSGGSVLLTVYSGQVGDNRIHAVGGARGERAPDSWYGGAGGAGSKGRVAYSYCISQTGVINPAAAETHLDCYIAESIPATPEKTRFFLPKPVSDSEGYLFQYGRLYTFTGTGGDTKELRLNRDIYSAAELDILVRNTGTASGHLNLCLDIGDDGSCELVHSGETNFPALLNAAGLEEALNGYLYSHDDSGWGYPANVPVRVHVDRQAEVMLTNLVAATAIGAKTRFIRLSAQEYESVTLKVAFGTENSTDGQFAYTVDVGGDGSVEWADSIVADFPTTVSTGNLAAAINAWLAGKVGEFDVPIRIVPSPSVETALSGFTATAEVDVAVGTEGISFDLPEPSEGDVVTVSTQVSNPETNATGSFAVSFFATMPGGSERSIGHAFIPRLAPSTSAPAVIHWKTLGFTGAVAVRAVVDPFNRVEESDEDNNETTAGLTVLTRADLQVESITLSDDEPVAGQAVDVMVSVRNTGETAAASIRLLLRDSLGAGEPIALCEDASGLAAGSMRVVACAWQPAQPGKHRLFAELDTVHAVNESNEANNTRMREVYIGLASPVLMDSGEAAADPVFDPAAGFGAVDNGQADVFSGCGSAPYQTFRQDPDGNVTYQFDHLLPGHFYHLDLTLYECGSNAGRQQVVLIDGREIAGPENLGDGQVHRLSLLIDPAFYGKDRSMTVVVHETQGGLGAVVNEINLHDIDYRYSDSGGGNDPGYPGPAGAENPYGWLDGSTSSWGPLPYQTARVDQLDNKVRYRYDGLDKALRYRLVFSFYQREGLDRQQQIWVDGVNTGYTVNVVAGQPATLNVPVPVETYYGDGSIEVGVQRTNATTGAMVNEIALEQRTVLTLPQISDVRVSNVTDTGATLSWLTDVNANGMIHYGTTTALGKTAQDARGGGSSTTTHFVNLAGLTANTTYYYYLSSGDTVEDNAGAYYTFVTGPKLSPPTSDSVYGQVLQPDGATPAPGALVYLTLKDANGQGTVGQGAPRAALVDSNGYWNADLSATRTADLSAYFRYSGSGDKLMLYATTGECSAAQEVDTANDSPAATLILVCPTSVTHDLEIGWNLLGPNVQTSEPTRAEAALDDIAAQGGNATEVDRWLNGGWDAHVHELPFNDFVLELGKGYFFRAESTGAWQRYGKPPASPLPLSLYSGWNLVSLPKLNAALNAESLLNGIATQGGACSEVDRWNAGAWEGHPKGVPCNNFTIATDEGYFVKCSAASTYNPGQATAAADAEFPAPNARVEAPAAAATAAITDVRITNLRDVAATISWQTTAATTGRVTYRQDGGAELVAYDDLGQDAVSTLHHVTLTGLMPGATYRFVTWAGEASHRDETFTFTTLPLQSPRTPNVAYGQIQLPDGSAAAGSLVYLSVANSSEPFSPLSALVDAWGYWNVDVPLDECAGVDLQLEAVGPDRTVGSATFPACAAAPAPVVQTTPRENMTPRAYLPLIVR